MILFTFSLTRSRFYPLVYGFKNKTSIDSVDRGTLGKTALTPEREVTDKSFTYHLSLSFSNIGAHNAYQDDSIHKDFVSKCKDMWERVIVYDTEDII